MKYITPIVVLLFALGLCYLLTEDLVSPSCKHYTGINWISDQEEAFGDYSPSSFGWLLSDPVMFENPIPCKGQLGLWNFDLDGLKSK